MAETPLSGIAKKILRKLDSPFLQEIAAAREVKELKKLQKTLSSLMPVLLDPEKPKTELHAVVDWFKRLQDVLNEADNLLEGLFSEFLRREVMTENNAAKKVRIFFSRLCLLAFSCKMDARVKGIRSRLDYIAEDSVKFHLLEEHEERSREEMTHSFVLANDVVGREKDKNAIIELMLESHTKDNVSIIPIVGIGGVGKTTLAKLVFNDAQVCKHFERRMWVSVSDVFDVKRISRNILESVTWDNCELLEMEEVVYELKRAIDGRKYFLVLDGVWNEDRCRWLELEDLLMGGARGSTVLITTRTQLVAEITGTVSPVFLKDLSESESWSLFSRMAFRHGELPEIPNLVEIGRDIVKKSAGVPLAVMMLGGLLSCKYDERDCLYLRDTELSDLDPSGDMLYSTLRLSYDYLPLNLKQCFAYCSLFPKGLWIDKQTLIQLWIAQGFIQLSSERQQLEDVGEHYFMELLRRSFFNDVQEDLEGNIISCKMHDLIHDLAQRITNENEIVGSSTHHISVSNHINLPKKLRRFLLATQEKESEHVILSNEDITSFKSVRVLDLHKSGINRVPRLVGELTSLSYLDLSENWFRLLPECVCMLQNLQTLKLNGCKYLKELPKETRKLVSLMHLEIQGCSLSHMPHGLGQLTSLQTLRRFVVCRTDKSAVGFSGGLSELEGLVNLQGTLSIERLRGSIAEEIGKKGQRDYYLDRLEFLESLSLFWDYVEPDAVSDDELLLESLQPHPNLKKLFIHGYGGLSLPSWMTANIDWFLPKLVEIELSGCCRCQNLTTLGLLPCLEILRLSAMESLEYIYEDDYRSRVDYDVPSSSSSSQAQGLFRSLKQLHLYYLKQLRGLGSRRDVKEAILREIDVREWSAYSFGGTRHLAALQELHISSCPLLDLYANDKERIDMGLRSLTFLSVTAMPQLVSLPLWLQSLTNLQPIEIQLCQNLILPEWAGQPRITSKATN